MSDYGIYGYIILCIMFVFREFMYNKSDKRQFEVNKKSMELNIRMLQIMEDRGVIVPEDAKNDER